MPIRITTPLYKKKSKDFTIKVSPLSGDFVEQRVHDFEFDNPQFRNKQDYSGYKLEPLSVDNVESFNRVVDEVPRGRDRNLYSGHQFVVQSDPVEESLLSSIIFDVPKGIDKNRYSGEQFWVTPENIEEHLKNNEIVAVPLGVDKNFYDGFQEWATPNREDVVFNLFGVTEFNVPPWARNRNNYDGYIEQYVINRDDIDIPAMSRIIDANPPVGEIPLLQFWINPPELIQLVEAPLFGAVSDFLVQPYLEIPYLDSYGFTGQPLADDVIEEIVPTKGGRISERKIRYIRDTEREYLDKIFGDRKPAVKKILFDVLDQQSDFDRLAILRLVIFRKIIQELLEKARKSKIMELDVQEVVSRYIAASKRIRANNELLIQLAVQLL